MRISDRHLQDLRRHGFVVVSPFLREDELVRALEAFHQYYPSEQELHAASPRYGALLDDPDTLQTEFPFASSSGEPGGSYLNHLSTHPAILSGVKRFLGTEDIRLSQAAIWAKYAGVGNYEQGLHFDYRGNTLVVPRDDMDFQQVNFILYYTDVTAELGPTAVVSKTKTRKVPLWPAFKTRQKHPELYKIEQKVVVPAGSMLIFTMSTLHRATAMTEESGARFSHHLVYRSGRHDFQGYHQWSRLGENEELEGFIAGCMPEQRHALGFPPPGHPFWTAATRKAVKLRYPTLDLRPYA
jgi:hypothetical protein